MLIILLFCFPAIQAIILAIQMVPLYPYFSITRPSTALINNHGKTSVKQWFQALPRNVCLCECTGRRQNEKENIGMVFHVV